MTYLLVDNIIYKKLYILYKIDNEIKKIIILLNIYLLNLFKNINNTLSILKFYFLIYL